MQGYRAVALGSLQGTLLRDCGDDVPAFSVYLLAGSLGWILVVHIFLFLGGLPAEAENVSGFLFFVIEEYDTSQIEMGRDDK